jgi:tripartite-type tricarboxylate transporter receptor subunit TctC
VAAQRTRGARALLAILAVASGLSVFGLAGVSAQSLFTRPITLVAVSAPGAINDFVTRLLGQELSVAIGQPVVVENRTAAGGVPAFAQVAKSPADGALFIVAAVGPAVIAPLISSNAKYDAATDVTPVILACETPNVLVASPKLEAKSVADVVAYAKKQGGRLSIGHPGIGTMGHLLGLLFASEAGIDASLIAYRGAAPLTADLAGGQIDIAFPAYGPGMDAVTLVAVATAEPVAILPGVPTMAQSGFAKVAGSTWYAVFGPPGLPEEITTKVNSALDAALAKDDIRGLMQKAGCAPIGGSPARLLDRVRADRGKWEAVVRAANIRID